MPVTLLDNARIAYRDKNYATTVNLSSKFISSARHSTETHIEALDLRCQAYTKLGKHDTALQDARHMIHMSKKLAAIGYLRCSQIEKNVGNYRAAAKWLEHGCKNVPKSRTVFETQLAKIKQLIKINVAFEKQRDPITSVPLEILQHLLTFFDYRETVRLLGVSKSWRNLLLNLHTLRTTIDFSAARRSVSFQSFNAAINRLCRFPKHIHFTLLSAPAVKLARRWLVHFPNLETIETLHITGFEMTLSEIRVHRLQHIRKLALESFESKDAVFKTICTAQSLQDVTLCGLSSTNMYDGATSPIALQIQNLTFHQAHDDLSPTRFWLNLVPVQLFPNLKTLSLAGGLPFPGVTIDLSTHHHLRELSVSLRNPGLELNLPVSLQKLKCDLQPQGPSAADAFKIIGSVDLRNLHTISCCEPGAFDIIRMMEKSGHSPKLLDVTIKDTSQRDLNALAQDNCTMFRNCQKLSFTSDFIVDVDLVHFIKLFPIIETLTLNAPLVTGVFISDLVKTNHQLKRVELVDCARVSSDITAWLRSCGVICHIHNNNYSTRDARRIRE